MGALSGSTPVPWRPSLTWEPFPTARLASSWVQDRSKASIQRGQPLDTTYMPAQAQGLETSWVCLVPWASVPSLKVWNPDWSLFVGGSTPNKLAVSAGYLLPIVSVFKADMLECDITHSVSIHLDYLRPPES